MEPNHYGKIAGTFAGLNYSSENERITGIVFDISLMHCGSGRRIVDVVKTQVVKYIQKAFVEDDWMYVFHPELTELLPGRGEQISMVGNYETDGRLFDLYLALKQTIYVLASKPLCDNRTMFLITDRLKSLKVTKKAEKIAERNDVQMVVIGIGSKCHKFEQPNYHFIGEPEELLQLMEKIDAKNV